MNKRSVGWPANHPSRYRSYAISRVAKIEGGNTNDVFIYPAGDTAAFFVADAFFFQSIDAWGTLSPDGQSMAFLSNRSGRWAI